MVSWTPRGSVARTLTREALDPSAMGRPARRVLVPLPASGEAALSYLATLDAFLSDLALTEEERASLDDLAAACGIGLSERQDLHARYLAALTAAAARDGQITAQEHHILISAAAALGVDASVIPDITSQPQAEGDLAGMRVCFTGTAVVKGQSMDRETLEALAALNGLQPVSSVSKTGCDLLVAADPASTSGKTQKARGYGIHVMGVDEFVSRLN